MQTKGGAGPFLSSVDSGRDVITVTAAAYSLSNADLGRVILMDKATAQTVTVPGGLSVGFNCILIQQGLGSLTLFGSGSTVNNVTGTLVSTVQYTMLELVSVAANSFIVNNVGGGGGWVGSAAKTTFTTTSEAVTGGAVAINFAGFNGVSYTEGLVINATDAGAYFPVHIKLINTAYTRSGLIYAGGTAGGVTLDSANTDTVHALRSSPSGSPTYFQVNCAIAGSVPSALILNGYATNIGLRIKLAASPSADALQVLTSADANVASIAPDGTLSLRGLILADQPRRVFSVIKTPGTAATLTAVGGTPTHTLTGTASNLSDSSGHYVSLSGDAAVAGVNIATTEVVKTENNPIITFVIKTGALLPVQATERIWVGMANADLSAVDSPTGKHVMAFRYAIDSDGTVFWRTVTNDVGADTGTVTVTTVAIAAATRYVLTINAYDPASIKFYINGALAATHTTDLPGTTTALGTQCLTIDAGAGTMEMNISNIRFETN